MNKPTAIAGDLDALAEALVDRIAPALFKKIPEIIAAQAAADHHEVSTREAARIAGRSPSLIGAACRLPADNPHFLPSTTTGRKTPAGDLYRKIKLPDLRRWMESNRTWKLEINFRHNL